MNALATCPIGSSFFLKLVKVQVIVWFWARVTVIALPFCWPCPQLALCRIQPLGRLTSVIVYEPTSKLEKVCCPPFASENEVGLAGALMEKSNVPAPPIVTFLTMMLPV